MKMEVLYMMVIEYKFAEDDIDIIFIEDRIFPNSFQWRFFVFYMLLTWMKRGY